MAKVSNSNIAFDKVGADLLNKSN